jgi:DNA-binding NarL/FixJ family response regulator
MDRMRVAIHAADTINQAGLLGLVESRPELLAVRADGPAGCDVFVVQADRLDERAVAGLRAHAGTPAVLISGDIGERELLEAVEHGVVAVLPRPAVTADLLARAVRGAATGRGRVSGDLVTDLLAHVERLRQDVLTAREIEVLRLMADGHDTAEIADVLCYSERTVKNVLYGITSRFKLRNRAHAVAYALRAGVI